MRTVARPTLAGVFIAGGMRLAGHRFWEIEDPGQRSMHRTHFLKNAAILGGVLVVALD